MSKIKTIYAREILDSRGNPTVQVEITTENNILGTANVPSGASTGSKEALELRDKNNAKYKENWFGGKGVQEAVDNVNKIIGPALISNNFDVFDQEKVDSFMINLDGTENKTKLGANAILGVSLALAHAAANEKQIPLYEYLKDQEKYILPLPMLNVLNGGAHASNTVDFQEFMIMPVSAKNFKEALKIANKVFHTLAGILKAKGHQTTVGDEGGFAPNSKSHEEVLNYLIEAITKAGFTPSKTDRNGVAIALDCAASEFYNSSSKKYIFKKLKNAIDLKMPGFENLHGTKVDFTTEELIKYYVDLVKKYPIISIEDPFDENDWDGFKKLNSLIGNEIQIVADDLTVTNLKLLNKSISEKAANSILIKLNQIGSLTETINVINKAQANGMSAVISHRSGETEDTTIADLAVAFGTGQIKTGSLSRTDRVAKYNRLLKIEDDLDNNSSFLGLKSFKNINVK
ncbi:phosphopyruvate hydratase [Mycoplasma sp. Mirounga ES2805-ORL]|uniref:phosphopyruvate hydratase n=1 Tax=Mycoplasma sp. Mirounga ES2805-ORL TaxID=754514 RepID=UPI00197C9D32|nr:phosphopyruvate hydratase [Mycoplasma sp. Mirounga ES2805-ORL]QSF13599.1 phosphopyruvate hydratase [Mycoplasma sp. Mirounga ES2805-ORL]